MGFVLGGDFPGGRYPGWEFSKWKLSGWELSLVGIVRVEVILGGNFLWWEFSGWGIVRWESSGWQFSGWEFSCYPYLPQSRNIGENSDRVILNFWSSGQSLIKRNCHNSRTSDDIDMKLRPVSHIDKRNKTTLTMTLCWKIFTSFPFFPI